MVDMMFPLVQLSEKKASGTETCLVRSSKSVVSISSAFREESKDLQWEVESDVAEFPLVQLSEKKASLNEGLAEVREKGFH